VAEGWAQGLARPGGNVTGLTVTFPDLASKRLELLKEAMPQLMRVGLLLDPDEIKVPLIEDAMRGAAQRMGVQVHVLEVRQHADFERAFRAAHDNRVQAILSVETPFVVVNRAAIAGFATRENLPLAGEFTAFGVEDMLMTYGPDLSDLLRRAASYVDRILKGTQPAELPIERPTKLELLVNLKVARELGITLPRSFLLRADKVIE
jgi:putative ABC transport system substrate-binding protein